LFTTAFAYARFVASIGLGIRHTSWALERVVAGLEASVREFGPLDGELAAAPAVHIFTPDERRRMQLGRLRRLVQRAAREVPYYEELFARLAFDPRRLTWQQLELIPPTTKTVLRDRPEDFIARCSHPVLTVETTGTTGVPTRVAFSEYELAVMRGLGTIAFMLGGLIDRDDVLVNAASPRAIGSYCITAAATRLGAHVRSVGVPSPRAMLSALSTRRRVPGHADRPTLLNANPSYLGMLAEEGAVPGMGPGAFGLRRIFTGGELVTAGLRERLVALFGDIDIQETYTATETVPFGARRCRHGHLHFEPTHGLLELVNPVTGRSAEPGEVATIVHHDAAPAPRVDAAGAI
jgi:phenylacetate-CoA ligase